MWSEAEILPPLPLLATDCVEYCLYEKPGLLLIAQTLKEYFWKANNLEISKNLYILVVEFSR